MAAKGRATKKAAAKKGSEVRCSLTLKNAADKRALETALLNYGIVERELASGEVTAEQEPLFRADRVNLIRSVGEMIVRWCSGKVNGVDLSEIGEVETLEDSVIVHIGWGMVRLAEEEAKKSPASSLPSVVAGQA